MNLPLAKLFTETTNFHGDFKCGGHNIVMIKFEAGNFFEALKSYRLDKFTGAVYLKTNQTLAMESRFLILSFHKGMITFVDQTLPTVEKLTELIKKKLNLPRIDSVFKAASSRVKNKNSIREPLEFIGRFGLFKWADFESAMQNRAVYHLEQILPYAGVLNSESPIDFDLSYGEDGHGFEWEKLQQELAQRGRMWDAFASSIPSMDAVPIQGKNRQAVASESMQKHIEQWMDGKRSLVDIANEIDQDPLKLAQHYLPWIQKGYIAFKPIPGNELQTKAAITEPPACDLTCDPNDKPIILSVDDSPIVQTMIKRAIGDRYQVLFANNAVSALNLLNTNNVALLLLDVTMPDIDGLELCKTIRSIGKFRDLPVVMLTAKDGLFDKMKSQFAGSTHYLTKPVDREKLLPVIDRYVGQGHPASFVKS
jgi:CheY-like chemotaxis protein